MDYLRSTSEADIRADFASLNWQVAGAVCNVKHPRNALQTIWLLQTGETALHTLISAHSLSLIQDAVDSGADVNAGAATSASAAAPCGSTLHAAVQRRDVDIVRLLLKAGADLKAVDSTGSTALHAAARNDDGEICRLLAQHGAPVSAVDALGATPLHAAAAAGATDALEAILDGGASASALDDRARTAADCVPPSAPGGSAMQELLHKAAGGGGAPPPLYKTASLPSTQEETDAMLKSIARAHVRSVASGFAAAPAKVHIPVPVAPAPVEVSPPQEEATPEVQEDEEEEEDDLDLDTEQIAALSVSAFHEKIQSSLESGAIGGYNDIYRALDEPGAGWFEAHHLAVVCNEIDIPVEDSIVPYMMRLIAEPAGKQDPNQQGGITRITWDEFSTFCQESRPPLETAV